MFRSLEKTRPSSLREISAPKESTDARRNQWGMTLKTPCDKTDDTDNIEK